MKDIRQIVDSIDYYDAKNGEVYPCTIVMDRYSGCYSGARWLAFNADNESLPEEVGGSDPEEDYFWSSDEHKKWHIGKGSTPDEAYKNLCQIIIQAYETKTP